MPYVMLGLRGEAACKSHQEEHLMDSGLFNKEHIWRREREREREGGGREREGEREMERKSSYSN